MRGAAVAGVAGDFNFVLELGFVDGKLHFNHFSRGLFFFFVVLVHGVLDVAKLAVDTERAADELHGGNELVGGDVFEDLNVFELLGGGFWRGGWFLGESGERCRKKANREKNSDSAKLSRGNRGHPWVSCELCRN